MPDRDLRVAVKRPRLIKGNALRTLIIISALLTLTACTTTTTTSSSGSHLATNPKNTLIAAKPQIRENKSTSAPAALVVETPAVATSLASAPSVDIAAPAETSRPAAGSSVENEIENSAPGMTMIDAEACTRGLRGELVTVQAGHSLLSDNGLKDGELESGSSVNPLLAGLSASPMAAPSAGTDETVAAMASPAALHVKLGQTEGLLVAAYQQTGRGYKAGGQTPASGFDSSGFTRWVYSQRGVTLPREAKKQAAGGRQVAKEELRPGDLLVYRDPSGKGESEYHVGIYTGQGNFLHAASKAGVVTETAAFGPQYAPYFVGGRRYYDDPKAAPLSDSQKMAAASSAVKLALSELGPNDKPDRSVIKTKSKSKSKAKKKK